MVQLRSYSTLRKIKHQEKFQSKMVDSFIALCVLFPILSISHRQKEITHWWSSLSEKQKKTGKYIQYSGYMRAFWWIGIYLISLRTLRRLIIFYKLLERDAFTTAYLNYSFYRQTLEGRRDYKFLKKKQGQATYDFDTMKHTHRNLVNIHRNSVDMS
jgi:hypothetical protein